MRVAAAVHPGDGRARLDADGRRYEIVVAHLDHDLALRRARRSQERSGDERRGEGSEETLQHALE